MARTLTPQGALTMDTVRALRDAGRAALREADLVLDLGAIADSDSAALACIFDLCRAAQAEGRALRVVALPEGLRHLAEVYGVAGLLPSTAIGNPN